MKPCDLFERTHRKNRRRRAARPFDIAPTARPAPRKKGVALIMVLVITTVMSAIAADLANESKVNVRAAANSRDQLQAYFHARSAVELELFMLRFQGQVKGMIEQFVPIPLFELSGFLVSSDTMKGILSREPTPSDERKKDTFSIDKPFGDFDGSFWIEEVVDENRKINLNDQGIGCSNLIQSLIGAVIDDPKYDPLFETIGDSRDPIRNRIQLIANITDYIDQNETVDTVCPITGDESTGGTTEDTRYQRLPYGARYKPRNGLMTSLAELRMVPGVNDAFMRLFANYFTVWSDKKGIAMQTADANMLRAVIRAISGPQQPGEEEKFRRFMEERSLLLALGPAAKLTQQVFVQLLQSAQINYDPGRLQRLIAAEALRFEDVSSVYRITAVGRVGDTTSTITVVWRDDRAAGELLYWREE
jgi:hypothetical protein